MRVITLDSNKAVIGIKDVLDEYVLETTEIKSELGEIGQIQQEDGSFITPESVSITPQPTLEDKINFLYYKSMGVI